MREGTDVTLVAFGKLVGYNLKVAEELEKEGISCEVGFVLILLACNPPMIIQTSERFTSYSFLQGPLLARMPGFADSSC